MAEGTPAYLVGNFAITDEGLMAEYAKQALPIVQKYGGQAILSDQNVAPHEGAAKSNLIVIRFPSKEAAEGFYHSAEYAPVKQMRIDATEGGFLLVSEGLPIR